MKSPGLAASIRNWANKSLIESGWAPISVIFLHVLMSRVFSVYAAFPGIDMPMHFVGGIAIAFFFHRASINGSQLQLLGAFHPITHALLVFFATCAATVFWEFAEFINDRYFGGHAQAGLTDTMRDMLIGIAGGVVLLCGLMPRLIRSAPTQANMAAR